MISRIINRPPTKRLLTTGKTYGRAFLLLCSTLCLSIIITGCQLVERQSQPAPVTQASSASIEQNLNQAIRFLEHGKSKAAKELLSKVLKQAPGEETAQRLMQQLTEAPLSRYGTEYFVYRVQQGDSFGLLAKKFLGHSLEFYGLARYNGITNPSRLVIGKKLKIPKTRGQSAKQESKPDKPVPLEYKNALTFYNNKQYLQGIRLLSTLSEIELKSKKTQQLLAKLLDGYITQQDSLISVNQASTNLNELKTTPAFKHSVMAAQERLNYLSLLYRSQAALFRKDEDEAYDFYLQASNLGLQENKLGKQLKFDLSEALHRTAVLYFRSQELERAIHLWDKILKIHPQHAPARSYRSRATKLNLQLQSID